MRFFQTGLVRLGEPEVNLLEFCFIEVCEAYLKACDALDIPFDYKGSQSSWLGKRSQQLLRIPKQVKLKTPCFDRRVSYVPTATFMISQNERLDSARGSPVKYTVFVLKSSTRSATSQPPKFSDAFTISFLEEALHKRSIAGLQDSSSIRMLLNL